MTADQTTTRTRTNPDVRRAQILEQAMQIIGEKGYNGFSVKELAQRCGLTNAGLLYYFGSKDQLLIALLEDRDRRDTDAVVSLAGLSTTAEKRQKPTLNTIHKSLLAIMELNIAQPEMLRLFTVLRTEAMNPQHPAQAFFIAREAATLKAFHLMITPYSKQPEATARQLLALMNGLQEQWLRSNKSFDLLAHWKEGLRKLLPNKKSANTSISRGNAP